MTARITYRTGMILGGPWVIWRTADVFLEGETVPDTTLPGVKVAVFESEEEAALFEYWLKEQRERGEIE